MSIVREVEVSLSYLQQVCSIGSSDHIINSTTAVLEALEQHYDLTHKPVQVLIVRLIKTTSRLLIDSKSSSLKEIVDTIIELRETLASSPLRNALSKSNNPPEFLPNVCQPDMDFLGFSGTKTQPDDVTIENLVEKLRIRPIEKFAPQFPKLEEDTDDDDVTMEEKKEETAEKHGEKMVEEEVKRTDDGREVRTKKTTTTSVSQSRCHVTRSTRGGGQTPTMKKFTDGTSFFDQDEDDEETESPFSLPAFKRKFSKPVFGAIGPIESSISPGQSTKQRTLEKTSEVMQSVTQKKEKNGRILHEQAATKTDLSELKANMIDTYQAGQLLDRKGSGTYEEKSIVKSENLALGHSTAPSRHATENIQNFQFKTDNDEDYLCGSTLFSYLRLSDNLNYHEEEYRKKLHFEFSGAGLNIQPLFGHLSDILISTKSGIVTQPKKWCSAKKPQFLTMDMEPLSLPDEEALCCLDATDYLSFRQRDANDVLEVHGGPVDGLIAYACQSAAPLLFREAFFSTYRTFITVAELMNRLSIRYAKLVLIKKQPYQVAANHTAGMIIRVVDEMSVLEVDSHMLDMISELVCQLIIDEKSIIARLLRMKIMDKWREKEAPKLSLYPGPKPPGFFQLKREQTIYDIKSSVFASQLTLIDSQLFQRIEIAELIVWSEEQKPERCPNITAFTAHFNKFSFWIRTIIILAANQKEREKLFTKFLRISKHLLKLGNFSSLFAVLSALSSSPLSRLEWANNINSNLQEQVEIMDTAGSYKKYREVLAKAPPPSVPYMGIVLQDLTFLNVGNTHFIPPDRCEGRTEMINFIKRWRQYAIMTAMLKLRKWRYDVKPDDNVLRFFRKFEEHLPEDEVWDLSHKIKPATARRQY